jgi:3-hydroxyisobutyryl-CoA hydrolase
VTKCRSTYDLLVVMHESSLLFDGKGISHILFTKLFPCFFCPGEYVALAGARLDGGEMLACGLATHFVQSNVGSLI